MGSSRSLKANTSWLSCSPAGVIGTGYVKVTGAEDNWMQWCNAGGAGSRGVTTACSEAGAARGNVSPSPFAGPGLESIGGAAGPYPRTSSVALRGAGTGAFGLETPP